MDKLVQINEQIHLLDHERRDLHDQIMRELYTSKAGSPEHEQRVLDMQMLDVQITELRHMLENERIAYVKTRIGMT